MAKRHRRVDRNLGLDVKQISAKIEPQRRENGNLVKGVPMLLNAAEVALIQALRDVHQPGLLFIYMRGDGVPKRLYGFDGKEQTLFANSET